MHVGLSVTIPKYAKSFSRLIHTILLFNKQTEYNCPYLTKILFVKHLIRGGQICKLQMAITIIPIPIRLSTSIPTSFTSSIPITIRKLKACLFLLCRIRSMRKHSNHRKICAEF